MPSFPPPLDQLEDREFSFYPSIEGVEANQWLLREANWSEFLVENAATQQQIWIPRRFLGDVSSTDRPVMIVGLARPLEYKAGQVWPMQKRVLEMPRVPLSYDMPAEIPGDTSNSPLRSAIRLDASEKRLGRLIAIALGISLALVLAIVSWYKSERSGANIQFQGVVQQSLGLGPDDDQFAVARKLGQPQSERWKEDAGEIQFHLLAYPNRNLNIILSARERKQVRYIGALDQNWKVVDSVTQKGGSNTYQVLAKLPRF